MPLRHALVCQEKRLAMQNGTFRDAKRAVLHCEMYRFMKQNASRCRGRMAVFKAVSCGFVDKIRCTTEPVSTVMRIAPSGYACTLIFRVFAGGCVLFSNARILKGAFPSKLSLLTFVCKPCGGLARPQCSRCKDKGSALAQLPWRCPCSVVRGCRKPVATVAVSKCRLW